MFSKKIFKILKKKYFFLSNLKIGDPGVKIMMQSLESHKGISQIDWNFG